MDLTCYNSYYEVNRSVLEENFKKISRFIAPAQVITTTNSSPPMRYITASLVRILRYAFETQVM